MTARVSLATIDDAEAILQVQRLAFQSEAQRYGDLHLPPLVESVRQFREALSVMRIYKAVADGRIIGSVRGSVQDGTCQVARLNVHPDYRRRHIALQLMAFLEAEFSTCTRFELYTGAESRGSLALYTRLGYIPFRTSLENGHIQLVHMRKENHPL